MDAIRVRFDLADYEPGIVKQADNIMLSTEMIALMAPPPQAWETLPPPLPGPFTPLSSEMAKRLFLERFKEVTLV